MPSPGPEALDEFLTGCFGPAPSAVAPSASVVVTQGGAVIYERDFGGAPGGAVYDLASVTKAAVTAPLLMGLVDSGTVHLDEPAREWLPEWDGTAFERVTLRQLLTHRSGLWEWRPIYLHAAGREEAVAFVTSTEPRHPPGDGRRYSDLGLILAGEIARRAGDASLAEMARDRLFRPLGLQDLGFNPSGIARERLVPSSRGDEFEERMVADGEPYPIPERGLPFANWRRHTLLGEANDCNAHHAFGGEAGHAGLFGTARDLARLGDAIAGGDLVSPATLEAFMEEPFDPGQGLVLRIASLAGRRAFWHPGFTGTRWLCCPDLELTVVLLTNRLLRPGPPVPLDDTWANLMAAVEAGFAPA